MSLPDLIPVLQVAIGPVILIFFIRDINLSQGALRLEVGWIEN